MFPERDRIKTMMTTAEIAAAMNEQDYSAEMLLQHLVRHYNQLERELEQVKVILADPLAVHLNMMRGTIKWTPANLRSLLGDSHREPT